LPLEKEDYQSQVSFKDSDLSTDHSAQLLANKTLPLKYAVIIIIIITSEMYLVNMRMPVNGQRFPFCVKERWNSSVPLTLILLMWRIWRAPNNASKWQMGFNLAFKGLSPIRT